MCRENGFTQDKTHVNELLSDLRKLPSENALLDSAFGKSVRALAKEMIDKIVS